jgi:PAS domain S-box-containing protein
LVVAAVVPMWWPGATSGAAWLGSVAVLAVALSAAWLMLRAVRESKAEERVALEQFSRHIRAGDVSAALRAVGAGRAPVPAGGADGDSVVAEAWSAVSRFGSAARELEQALGERERRWQARMRLSADWHWETDAEVRFTWVSQDLASLVKLGVRPSDLLGHRIDAVPVFEPPAEGWAALNERLAEHKPVRELVLEVRRAGRMPVWVALNARAYRDEQGRFTGYEGVGRDITEQHLAFARLAESERRHALMAELSVDWYWQTDAEHRLEQFGPAARALLGERANEAIGQARWALHPQGATEQEWAAHRADLQARRPFRGFEYAERPPGRSRHWVSISGQPRLNGRGEFIGYHGVGTDITLRKRAERMVLGRNQILERQVAERTAELEHTNRDLEAFARQLAHELRTPIGQVGGLAELLKARTWERLADDEREWLRLQMQAARDMSETVTALLELARSASTALEREAVDLSALARSVIDELPPLERKAAVDWVIEPGLTENCSATLARVALVNLLGNAAKFTRDVAKPRVEFTRHGSAEAGGFVISDNGVGFDPGHLERLFLPFARLHDSEQFHGTGLGLSIVRRIVERHGGTVAAAGEPGRGARFAFRFTPPRVDPISVLDSSLGEPPLARPEASSVSGSRLF